MVSLNSVGIEKPVANLVNCMATYTELLSHSVTNLKKEQIDYYPGVPVLDKETVFVPITADITLFTDERSLIKFTETFVVAFQEQEELPSKVSVTSVGRMSMCDSLYHGVANEYHIYDSLEIFIA